MGCNVNVISSRYYVETVEVEVEMEMKEWTQSAHLKLTRINSFIITFSSYITIIYQVWVVHPSFFFESPGLQYLYLLRGYFISKLIITRKLFNYSRKKITSFFLKKLLMRIDIFTILFTTSGLVLIYRWLTSDR